MELKTKRYKAEVYNYEVGESHFFYCDAESWEKAHSKILPHPDSTLSLMDLQEVL